jgi:hypothetical protein
MGVCGAALNEGRALFPGDREFGQWVAEQVHPQLGGAPHDDERAAAMWAGHCFQVMSNSDNGW